MAPTRWVAPAGNPAVRTHRGLVFRVFLAIRSWHGQCSVKAAMSSRRTWWIALLTVLTMVGGPASALAIHAQCEVQHHACDETVADMCCCGHVTGTESQQVASNVRVGVVAPAAELLTVVPEASPHWGPDVHELVPPHVGHLVIDRLTLFQVLLI